MIAKNITRMINDFISSINKNSSLKFSGDALNRYRYPYKPALIIAIFIHNNDPSKLFNRDISLKDLNSPILKTYFELITNSNVFFQYLCTQSSKQEWRYGYKNKSTRLLVRRNIFECPAKFLSTENNNFWESDSKKFTVKMNINIDEMTDTDLREIKNLILSAAHKRICECIPDYFGFSLDEILAYYDTIYLQTEANIEIINRVLSKEETLTQRKFIYGKLVKERDNKCVICCKENPLIIQACHIKPFSRCESQKEAIDIENGVTLCANHHLLFDKGFFSFDDQWKVIISPKWSTNDLDILIRTFEPCYHKSNDNRSRPNRYLDFHRREIFLS